MSGCVRCGYCCINLTSVVVDDPEKGISDDNLTTNFDTRCKHLRGNKAGEYWCAIHDYPWYPETPCYQYQKLKFDIGGKCNMGEFLLKKEKEPRPI